MLKANGRLIAMLQKAYSGELAAALAYRGHWKSVKDEMDRTRIRQIEGEEWHHRKMVHEMLSILGAQPLPIREARAYLVGRLLGFLCGLTGALLPLYAAGRLESRNIVEYESAAQFAIESGHSEFLECILKMAEVEWEHEHYFRGRVLQYKLPRFLRLWPAPPPKQSIRSRYIT